MNAKKYSVQQMAGKQEKLTKKKDKEKTFIKMLPLNPTTISVISLNINIWALINTNMMGYKTNNDEFQ